VRLGPPTVDASRLYAMPVTTGHPSWVGALAGVAPGLAVYHVTEQALKAEIGSAGYDEHVAFMAMAMDVDAIGRAVRDVREGQGTPSR
jgi:glycine/sarcosine/betaine reductase complex component A